MINMQKITKKDYEELKNKIQILSEFINGGKGSGNFGHAGRQGLIGGSGKGSYKSFIPFHMSADKAKQAFENILSEQGIQIVASSIPYSITLHAYEQLDGQTIDKKIADRHAQEVYGKNYDELKRLQQANLDSRIFEDKETIELRTKMQKYYEDFMTKAGQKLGTNVKQDALYIPESSLKELEKLQSQKDIDYDDVRKHLKDLVSGGSFSFDLGCSEFKSVFKTEYDTKDTTKQLVNQKMVEVSKDYMKNMVDRLNKNTKKNSFFTNEFPPINRQEERALKEYNLASAVNQQLRSGEKPKSANLISSAIDKNYSTTTEPLYRGIKGDFAKTVSNMKKNEILTDKGFMSTSFDIGDKESGARKFGDTILKIKPKTGFGVGISMGSYVQDTRYLSENEFLLQKDTKLRFTGNVEDAGDTKIMEFEIL